MAKSSTAKATKEAPQKPISKHRVGHVTADVWANKNDEGKFSYSVTLQKSYKDDSDKWHNTDFLFASDIQQARKALDLAHTWVINAYETGEV